MLPGRTARRPEAGEDDLRVAGIEDEVHASGVFIFVENFLEGLAAVEGAEDAALGVGAVGVSLSGDEEAVGIFWVDDDGGDLLGVCEERRPVDPDACQVWPASVDL